LQQNKKKEAFCLSSVTCGETLDKHYVFSFFLFSENEVTDRCLDRLRPMSPWDDCRIVRESKGCHFAVTALVALSDCPVMSVSTASTGQIAREWTVTMPTPVQLAAKTWQDQKLLPVNLG
jgi:hypothetical protein